MLEAFSGLLVLLFLEGPEMGMVRGRDDVTTDGELNNKHYRQRQRGTHKNRI